MYPRREHFCHRQALFPTPIGLSLTVLTDQNTTRTKHDHKEQDDEKENKKTTTLVLVGYYYLHKEKTTSNQHLSPMHWVS